MLLVLVVVVVVFERFTVDIVPICGIFIVDVVFFTVFANAEDNADIFPAFSFICFTLSPANNVFTDRPPPPPSRSRWSF